MSRIGCLGVSILVAFTAPVAIASTCPAGNRVADPADFVWTDMGDHFVGTMEISEATFNIGGETLTTRAYGQAGSAPTIPAPTLRMTPGEKYVLRFHNTLPYEAPDPGHNVFKDPNISNLHTHGLHISGESPGDDVTRSFEGGFGGDFVYDIPADHIGGTYWYHAHHHGSTFLQVAGGGLGLIVVDDSADGLPANVAAMQEHQLVLAFLDPNAAGTGGDTLMSGTLNPTWTVNGLVGGDVCVPQGEWRHFRVLVADPVAMERDVEVNGNCEVALLARDGVWRTTAPKVLNNNTIGLTGASRADLAVRCVGDADITVGGAVVANIYADAALPADTTVGPFSNGATGGTWSATRPNYLRDLSGVPAGDIHNESINMGARTVNGSKFDVDVPTVTVMPDQVQEWSLSGARRHPFHLHVYHVQADGCGGDFEDGEYYDVVASNCSIRFDLDADGLGSPAYEGRTIMHCHILEHEDQGAMGWMDVVPTANTLPPPTLPAGHGYGEYYALTPNPTPPAAPSGLAATATSSSTIDLTWTDNANNEDGFHVERSTDGTNFTQIDSLAANTTGYTDGGLAAETTYFYRVVAHNAEGTGTSNTDSATTPALPSPPSAPSGLAAIATGASTIDLNWTDNANNEDGFHVERSTDGSSFAQIDTVGANTTSYGDSGLSPETTYFYRVVAFNGAGTAASNTASATTEAQGQATDVDLGSLTVSTVNIGQGNKRGQAVVTVVDNLGSPVSGATVTGTFSGTFNEGASGSTDGGGSVTLQTSGAAKGNVSVTFCVTSITHPTLNDWSGNSCSSN